MRSMSDRIDRINLIIGFFLKHQPLAQSALPRARDVVRLLLCLRLVPTKHAGQMIGLVLSSPRLDCRVGELQAPLCLWPSVLLS